MLELDARKMIAAATAVATTGADSAVAAKSAANTPKLLSPAALEAAAQPTAPAWSPIVVAGTVRMAEFALTALVGLAVYLAYVVPIEGFEWRYAFATLGIAVLAMLAFQIADIYQIQ